MNHFSPFAVVLTVSFALGGVFSLMTGESLMFRDATASIFTPAYGKLSQATPPSLFSPAMTACCLFIPFISHESPHWWA